MEIKKLQTDNLSMYGNPTGKVRLKEHNSIQNNNIQNYRPAERLSLGGSERSRETNSDISFTGDPKLVTKIAKEALQKGSSMDIPAWAEKMGGADWFKKVLHSVNKNETFYEAVVALGVAGILKPICVLAMPGAEMEDKQMSATKNFVSAVAGFGLSNLILSPCSDAVNKITKSFDSKNPTQYIKDMDYINALKNEELLAGMKSTLGDSFKTTYKKVWDVGVSPLKAGITLALMPYVLKALFGDKKKKKEENKPQNNPLSQMTVMNTIRMDKNSSSKKANPSFTGNGSTETKQNSPFAQNEISFTGKEAAITDAIKTGAAKVGGKIGQAKEAYCGFLSEPIAKFMGKLSGTTPARKLVETFAHFDKPTARWSDMASFAITYFYINNTRKSEKIEEERKLPLMINNFMVTVASSTAAFLIDKYTDKPMENLLKGYLVKHEDTLHKQSAKTITETLEKALKATEVDKNEIANLTRHSDDILQGADIKSMSSHLQDAIQELKNNDVVQKAIKSNIISADDISKMAVSGFEKQASSVFKNIMKAKSLTVFTLTVRFLVTVLMTPVIGRVVDVVNKKLGRGKYAQDKNLPQSANIPPAGSETIGMKDFLSTLNK